MHESVSAAGTAGLLYVTPCTRHKSACGAPALRDMEVEALEADQGNINLHSWVKPSFEALSLHVVHRRRGR